MSDNTPVQAGFSAISSKLVEAFKSSRCPICSLLQDDEFQELCHWVGGNVADGDNRRKLDSVGGFCNYHFWQLKEIHSPQSGSLVNDYVVTKFLDALRNLSTGEECAHSHWLQSVTEHCPLCIHIASREAIHLRALADWLNKSIAWREFENSRGLCLPHLVRLQALIDDQMLRKQLTCAQVAQVVRLQKEMRDFVRQFDAGQRWEISHDEWKAWERAIEKLVGRKGTR